MTANHRSKVSAYNKFMLSTLLVIAALLSGLALFTAHSVRVMERDFPPGGEFVESGEGRLHYVELGAGPPLVLLHGANTSARDFAASIAPGLAVDHHVVAIDRPGYGYSDRSTGAAMPAEQARAMHEVIKALGMQRPTIVGHSFGGAVALAYALAYPSEVSGVVLLGGVAYPWASGVAWHNHVAHWPIVGPVFAHSLVYPVGRLKLTASIEAVFAPAEPTPDYASRTGIVLALRPAPYRASAEDLLHLSRHLKEQSRRYAELTAPVLMITGAQDTVVPAWRHAERLQKVLVNQRLRRIDGVGHAPHHSRPDLVVQWIREFVAKNGGQALASVRPNRRQKEAE